MNDLISRQAAIGLVRDVCDAILSQCGSHYDGDDEVYDNLQEVDAVLKGNKEIRIALANMPSEQPEIIQCQDCKYASPNGEYGCKAYHFKLYETHEMKADDFCSRAKRRNDGRSNQQT